MDESSKAARDTCDDLTCELKYMHSQLSTTKQNSRDAGAIIITMKQQLKDAMAEVRGQLMFANNNILKYLIDK